MWSAACGRRKQSEPSRRRSHAAPFVPSGTGMWIHEWPKTMHGNARAIVRRAAAYGITTIYLRTGTKKGGFDGAPQLRALLIATRGTNIRVVPWDFPLLNNPRGDAYRLAKAARYRVRGAHMPTIRAIAPDIETGAEGTRIGAARVRTYFLWLRRYLPRSTSILSTVPWPSENRRGRFPYTTIARYSNALMPMAYWYNRNAYSVTNYSIRWLQRFHRPVLPVGQGFDSKLDASYLPHSNQWREIADFMHAARNNHVRAVSLWSWQTAAKPQWRALAAYRHVFHPPVPPKPKPRPRRPAVKAAPEHVWVQRLRPIPG